MHRVGVVIVAVLMTVGCGGPGVLTPPPAPVSTPNRVEEGIAGVPEWRRGDRWVYDWTSGAERGTRTVEVKELAVLNGVDYYVVEISPTTQQYYTKDLHFAASVQASRVLARMVPPQPWFVWPLKIGAHWEFQGVFEEQQGSKKENDRFVVVGLEEVTVPGGTFRAFKVQRQTDRPDADQYWYAPDVRWYVRWIGRRGTVEFEEVLRAYQATSRGASSGSTR
jgi:hypothetical protein